MGRETELQVKISSMVRKRDLVNRTRKQLIYLFDASHGNTILMTKPPVQCDICERCTCFCAKSVNDVLFESGDKLSDLEANIEKIKERERYLRFLRLELEAEASQRSSR